MSERPKGAIYVHELQVPRKGLVFLTGHLYELDATGTETTRGMIYVEYPDGSSEWLFVADFPGISHSILIEEKPFKHLWLLTRSRELWRDSPDGPIHEEIPLGAGNGYTAGIRRVGSKIYVCGGQYSVMTRTNNGWEHRDRGIFLPAVDGKITGSFHELDGSNEDDMYAVGAGGVLGHGSGNTGLWNFIESPTNYDLYGVLARSGLEIYLCGAHGGLFRGNRKDGWHFVGLPDSEEVLYSMTWFQERLWVCSINGLWFLGEDDKLHTVQPELDGELSFYKLSACPEELWATSGAEALYRFDGQTWSVIYPPGNEYMQVT